MWRINQINLIKLLNTYNLNYMFNTEKNDELFLYYCMSHKRINAWNRYFHNTDCKVYIVKLSCQKLWDYWDKQKCWSQQDTSHVPQFASKLSTSSPPNWQMGEGSQHYVELTSCSYSKKIWKFLSLLKIGWDDSLCRKTSCTWTVFLNTARYSLKRKHMKQ